MSEIILEKKTYCPTGLPADEISMEIVLEISDPLEPEDPTPRTVSLVRLFTRGNLGAWLGQERDIMITVGRDASRQVLRALRLSSGSEEISLSALGLAVTYPRLRGGNFGNFDFYAGPALGDTPPTPGTNFDTYRARPPRPRPGG